MINEEILDTIINDVTWSYEESGDKVPQNILDTLNEIKQMFKNQPTFDECIKKWEEKGYEVNISIDRKLVIESEKYDLTINICKANLIYEISNYYENEPAFMTPELHELLTQTLKAMEVENGK